MTDVLDKYRALSQGNLNALGPNTVVPEQDDAATLPNTQGTPVPPERDDAATPTGYTAVDVHPSRESDPRFPEATGPIAAEQAARIVELAVKLRKHGRSYRSIADTVGVAHTTVRRWCELENAKPLRNPTVLNHPAADIVRELLTLPPYSELVLSSARRKGTVPGSRVSIASVAETVDTLSERVAEHHAQLDRAIESIKTLTKALTKVLQDNKQLEARLAELEDAR